AGAPRAEPGRAIDALKQRVMGFVGLHFDPLVKAELLSHVPTYDAYREYTNCLEVFGVDYPEAIRHCNRAVEASPDFTMWPKFANAISYYNQSQYAAMEPLVDELRANRDRYSEYERMLIDWWAASVAGNDVKGLDYLRRAEKMDPDSYLVNYLI